MKETPLIELRDLSFSHAGEQTLAHIDLSVAASEFIAVIGPSGCGKSTLLRLVGGLLMPSSGEVLVGGKNVTGPGLDRAMVFQDYSLFPWSSCADNIVLETLDEGSANVAYELTFLFAGAVCFIYTVFIKKDRLIGACISGLSDGQKFSPVSPVIVSGAEIRTQIQGAEPSHIFL